VKFNVGDKVFYKTIHKWGTVILWFKGFEGNAYYIDTYDGAPYAVPESKLSLSKPAELQGVKKGKTRAGRS
jgi:hypothetical protein